MVNFSLVYIQTMYNVFCLLLQIPLGRNNIMTLYSVKKGVSKTPLITGIWKSNIFSFIFTQVSYPKKKKKKKLEWADVAVVLKTTILPLVTYLVSLNCPITFRIIDQTLRNFQGCLKYSCRCSLKTYMTNGWELPL